MNPTSTVQETLLAEQIQNRRREQLLQGENEVLKLIVERAPLTSILELLTRVAQRQSTTGLLASILLLDDDGKHLRHGAAPSLPRAYSKAIDGLEIGPQVGSCGTAAYFGHQVVVSDIATDPLWEAFRSLALQHGLSACWSTPILSMSKAVLGTFALYYTHVCVPDADDQDMINMLTRTAALAIEHDRTAMKLRESEDRFRLLTYCAPVGVFMTDRADTFSYVNPRFVELGLFEHDKTFEHWLTVAAQRPDLAQQWREAITERNEFIRQFPVTHGGVTRGITLRAVPLESGSGKFKGYVGTLECKEAPVS